MRTAHIPCVRPRGKNRGDTKGRRLGRIGRPGSVDTAGRRLRPHPKWPQPHPKWPPPSATNQQADYLSRLKTTTDNTYCRKCGSMLHNDNVERKTHHQPQQSLSSPPSPFRVRSRPCQPACSGLYFIGLARSATRAHRVGVLGMPHQHQEDPNIGQVQCL